MKQISEVETTTSSRPSLNSLMTLPHPGRSRNRLAFIIGRLGQQGTPAVLAFYDNHPISEAQVMAALRRRGLGLAGPTAPEDLFDLDQDHYGGPAAVEALALRAGITAGSRVLDVCAGLGGPARVLAHRRGCRVVACELNRGRAVGAARLSRLVGLTHRVAVVPSDARALPFAGGRFDACISQ